MAQIFHGECAIGGGGGGGVIPPETQALGTPSHLPVPGRLSRLSATPSHAPRPETMPLIRPWLYFWKFLFSFGSLLIVFLAAAAASIEFARRIDSIDINATPKTSEGHHGWAFLYGLMIGTVKGSLRWLLPFSFLYFSHILGSSIILVVHSGYFFLNRKFVTVVIYLGFGFLLLALVLFAGIHMSPDDSLAMTHGSEIKTLNYHKHHRRTQADLPAQANHIWPSLYTAGLKGLQERSPGKSPGLPGLGSAHDKHSHGRELLSFSHDTHADGSGQDQKALPQWTTNQNRNQSAEDYEEKREKQNGPDKPHWSKHEIIVVVVSCIAVVLALLVVYCIVLLLRCYRVKRAQQKGLLVQRELCRLTGCKAFQYDELVAATDNFDQENKLGQGGFGPVYRGFLRDPDRHVAIKQLSAESSSQGQREFDAEVEVLTQVRHRNIVQFVGWCQSNQGLFLVYELMAQGSLDMHLHNPDRNLSWQQRYKIILDLGSALLYLHRCCEKCIVHGDIKPQNVMLDASFNAKLGDFGTARLVQHGADPRTTQIVAGTPGYIDPDFINSRLRCPEADIYSFGVTLLEIASGKRPASRLPTEVRSLYDRHMILDAADVKMNGNFDRQQMRHVLVTGLWCAHQDPSQRPSIEQAMDVLRCVDVTLPVLPATCDPQQVRFLEEQAYRDLTGEGASVDVAAASTCYHTSKDSAYLLAEE